MSGETLTNISPWTVDTLHQLVMHLHEESASARAEMDLRYQQRFDASQQALQAALVAAEKSVITALASAERAVLKAENAAERRFESVNEFRNTLADQASRLLARSEAEARFQAADEKLSTMSGNLSKLELDLKGSVRRDDLKPINDAVDKLRDNQAVSGGKSAAYGAMGAAGLSLLALIIALFGVFNGRPDPNIAPPYASTQRALSEQSSRIDQLQHAVKP